MTCPLNRMRLQVRTPQYAGTSAFTTLRPDRLATTPTEPGRYSRTPCQHPPEGSEARLTSAVGAGALRGAGRAVRRPRTVGTAGVQQRLLAGTDVLRAQAHRALKVSQAWVLNARAYRAPARN